MSSTAGVPGETVARAAAKDYVPDEGGGIGWVVFAGTMLAIVGVLNLVYGIAAVSDSRFYVRDAAYVISDLNTWGWALIAIGAIQLVSAFGIWAQMPGARWVGILTASVNAVVQMLVIPGSPFLAITLFAIDIMVIYGLLAYGRRPGERTS
jgi:hypothetical protein